MDKWYMHRPDCPGKWDIKILFDFEIKTNHSSHSRWPELVLVNRKRRTCQPLNFTISADHRVKLKQNEKLDKY